jgi:hypothetical protein
MGGVPWSLGNRVCTPGESRGASRPIVRLSCLSWNCMKADADGWSNKRAVCTSLWGVFRNACKYNEMCCLNPPRLGWGSDVPVSFFDTCRVLTRRSDTQRPICRRRRIRDLYGATVARTRSLGEQRDLAQENLRLADANFRTETRSTGDASWVTYA